MSTHFIVYITLSRVVTDASGLLDGYPMLDWQFHQSYLDTTHCVAVCTRYDQTLNHSPIPFTLISPQEILHSLGLYTCISNLKAKKKKESCFGLIQPIVSPIVSFGASWSYIFFCTLSLRKDYLNISIVLL